jgi:hypothetical protein
MNSRASPWTQIKENAYPKVQIGVFFINQSFKDQCCIFSSFYFFKGVFFKISPFGKNLTS